VASLGRAAGGARCQMGVAGQWEAQGALMVAGVPAVGMAGVGGVAAGAGAAAATAAGAVGRAVRVAAGARRVRSEELGSGYFSSDVVS
jgi:hypothetical protein